jgi:hypothetical protein
MITEITFQQPVCIGRTNTREARFRSDDGWTIDIDDKDVFLTHRAKGEVGWQFRVRNVGFTYVEVADEPAKKGKANASR